MGNRQNNGNTVIERETCVFLFMQRRGKKKEGEKMSDVSRLD